MIIAWSLLAACGGGSAGVHLADGPAQSAQEEVSLTVQRDAEPLVESVVVIPQVQMERYVLTPGTPEAEEVAEILSDYTYRRWLEDPAGGYI